MYIGEAAKITGLSIKAIRFYEEKGLIPKPNRSGRYRVYQHSDIEILLLIKEAKSFGVTLAQLKSVIVYSNGQVDWAEVQAFLALQRNRIIDEIRTLKDQINKIDECVSQINVCPLSA